MYCPTNNSNKQMLRLCSPCLCFYLRLSLWATIRLRIVTHLFVGAVAESRHKVRRIMETLYWRTLRRLGLYCDCGIQMLHNIFKSWSLSRIIVPTLEHSLVQDIWAVGRPWHSVTFSEHAQHGFSGLTRKRQLITLYIRQINHEAILPVWDVR